MLEQGILKPRIKPLTRVLDPVWLLETMMKSAVPNHESMAALVMQEVHPLEVDSVLRFLQAIHLACKAGFLAYEASLMECFHWWNTSFPELECLGKLTLHEAHNDPMLSAQDPVFPGRPFPDSFRSRLPEAMLDASVPAPVAFKQVTAEFSSLLPTQLPIADLNKPATREECEQLLTRAKQNVRAAAELFTEVDKTSNNAADEAAFALYQAMSVALTYETMLDEYDAAPLHWNLF